MFDLAEKIKHSLNLQLTVIATAATARRCELVLWKDAARRLTKR